MARYITLVNPLTSNAALFRKKTNGKLVECKQQFSWWARSTVLPRWRATGWCSSSSASWSPFHKSQSKAWSPSRQWSHHWSLEVQWSGLRKVKGSFFMRMGNLRNVINLRWVVVAAIWGPNNCSRSGPPSWRVRAANSVKITTISCKSDIMSF